MHLPAANLTRNKSHQMLQPCTPDLLRVAARYMLDHAGWLATKTTSNQSWVPQSNTTLEIYSRLGPFLPIVLVAIQHALHRRRSPPRRLHRSLHRSFALSHERYTNFNYETRRTKADELASSAVSHGCVAPAVICDQRDLSWTERL